MFENQRIATKHEDEQSFFYKKLWNFKKYGENVIYLKLGNSSSCIQDNLSQNKNYLER